MNPINCQNTERITYRLGMDSLRGLAVILVILFHAYPSVLWVGLIESIIICNPPY